jgi:hypothetical protein
MLSPADLQREAAALGFRGEALEKVIRLLEVLDGVRSHPFLKSRMVLKGGTALNLFVLDVPRLSVDIDLNYIGAADRETMLAERPQVEQALQAVFGRLGLQVRRVPGEHAGGKWRLSYTGVDGRSGTLEVDVNFLLRTPWPPVMADSRRVNRSASAASRAGHPRVRPATRCPSRTRAETFDVRGRWAPAFDSSAYACSASGISRRDWREVSSMRCRWTRAMWSSGSCPCCARGAADLRRSLRPSAGLRESRTPVCGAAAASGGKGVSGPSERPRRDRAGTVER